VKLVVDMNLSPDWIPYLEEARFEAIHWSSLGKATALDGEIFENARQSHSVIFTHDLDFGSMLALTNARAPSVVQVRTQDITPSAVGPLVIKNLRHFQRELEQGALLVIDEARSRVRILPLNIS
jgi:predicted nuclease of predicted toxin-antitoxin system